MADIRTNFVTSFTPLGSDFRQIPCKWVLLCDLVVSTRNQSVYYDIL